MSKLYKYYQLPGSQEWHLTHADANIDSLSPEFVTVLALDTILGKTPTREEKDAVKYSGPMYFDLDSADIEDSINDAKKLAIKLKDLGLEESDVEVFLSGKKGFHFLIDQRVFIDKPVPKTRLPAIYKEMAFNLAVNSVDFVVYSAGMGRMLRTCFNVRDNGLRRVPVSMAELENLTPESYKILAANPRLVGTKSPQYRLKLGLIYEAAAQKLDKLKVKKSKPVDQQTLRGAVPTVQQILRGEGLKDIGFNRVALQIALFARESNWSAERLIEEATLLCQNWESDGRYNTPRRREAELRRMFYYLQDNPTYEFSLGTLKGLLEAPSQDPMAEGASAEGEGDFGMVDLGNVADNGYYYTANREDSSTAISNFSFSGVRTFIDTTDGTIRAVRAKLRPNMNETVFTQNQVSSSATLHGLASKFGLTFTGTDTHARGVWHTLMKNVQAQLFEIETEGVNLMQFDNCGRPELAGQKFLVWVDRFTVLQSADLAQHNLELVFRPADGSKTGITSTDLSRAPEARDWVETEGNRERLIGMVRNMLAANNTETVAKCLGWMTAATYKPVIQKAASKFPLLHVYGPAGLGKTEFTDLLLSMYYYRDDKKSITPSSTPYALITMLGGSSSIPLILDEWKPATLPKEKAEEFRGILRDAYNNKSRTRGGGNSRNTSTAALAQAPLSCPLIFISEAAEIETAIVERSVMTSFKRSTENEQASSLAAFNALKADTEPLTVVGKFLVAQLLACPDVVGLMAEFNSMTRWAEARYTVQANSADAVREGRMTPEEYKLRQVTKPRPLFNAVVVMFGLVKFRKAIETLLHPEKLPEDIEVKFRDLMRGAFASLQRDAQASRPEYIKVLGIMSDMTATTDSQGRQHLEEGLDYAISEYNGKGVLVLTPRMAYNKYMLHMRQRGLQPLYQDADVFESSLRETPAFMRSGVRLPKSSGETLWLSADFLASHKVDPFRGRCVTLSED